MRLWGCTRADLRRGRAAMAVFRRARDLDPDAFNRARVYAGPGMSELVPPGYGRPLGQCGSV